MEIRAFEETFKTLIPNPIARSIVIFSCLVLVFIVGWKIGRFIGGK